MSFLNKHAISKIRLTASAVALTMVSGFAQANPVTAWTFSTNATFSAATWTSGDGTTTQLPSELSWGATGGAYLNGTQSALTIGTGTSGAARYGGGPATGSINTTIGGSPNAFLGQIGIGTSLTHWNNPLAGNLATLAGATIADTLRLTPIAPSGYTAFVDAPTLLFNFHFQETTNSGNGSGLCAGGALASSIPGGCPDLFGFNGVTLNNAFQYIDSGIDGVLGGVGSADDFLRTYYASIFVLDVSGGAFPLQQLVAGECAAINLNTGCFGFRTLESQETTAQFAFAITTEPVQTNIPEPGSVGLLGLGLAGLVAIRRRRLI